MKLYKLTAFPKTTTGGNKAGVVIDADELTVQDMLQIAKDVGYSETAFVLKSDKADFKVRFFTPTNEVDLCGHATIATFNLLRDLNIITPGLYTQETKAGILELVVKNEIVFMQQNTPFFSEILSVSDIKSCFSNMNFVHENLPIQILSTGLREIFIPVKSQVILNNLKPNFNAIETISKKYGVIGIHAFCLDKIIDAYGRNFAPLVGINEESATGTSNGALACYLYKHLDPKHKYVLRQGYSMNQPSEIIAKLESNDNVIRKVWVGGSAETI